MCKILLLCPELFPLCSRSVYELVYQYINFIFRGVLYHIGICILFSFALTERFLRLTLFIYLFFVFLKTCKSSELVWLTLDISVCTNCVRVSSSAGNCIFIWCSSKMYQYDPVMDCMLLQKTVFWNTFYVIGALKRLSVSLVYTYFLLFIMHNLYLLQE